MLHIFGLFVLLFFFLTEALHIIYKRNFLILIFQTLKNQKAALQCLHETLLNTGEVFARGNEAHNSYCLKVGKLLKLNVSQEIFLKNCNSGEQYYQFIFCEITLSSAIGGDK